MLSVRIEGREVWVGRARVEEDSARVGLLGFRVEAHSHLEVDRFALLGRPETADFVFLHTEALLGAGGSPEEWTQSQDASFRYGTGSVSRVPGARAKWNVIGTDLKLWSPRGPTYGTIEVRLDGRPAAMISLNADKPVPSAVVWTQAGAPHTFHALAVIAKSGQVPLDCLEVGVRPGEATLLLSP